MKTPCCNNPRLVMDESFSYEVPLAEDGTATIDTGDYATEGFENLRCTNCDKSFSRADDYRECYYCSQIMFEGYLHDDMTLCSEKCLGAYISREDWAAIDHEKSDESYWTAWTELREVTPKERLEYLRQELRAERISTGELAELESLKEHIEPEDVELLEAAGVPEQA